MALNEILDDCFNKMCQLNLYYRDIKETSQTTLTNLNSYEELHREKLQSGQTIASHAMYFKTPTGGASLPYGRKSLTIDQQRTSLILHKNKQFQWLLAEAYEVFEDTLFRFYAYAGFIDNGFWPLNDYGNVTLSELQTLDLQWFLKQAKKKAKAPRSIMNHFRKVYPRVPEIEKHNHYQVNLRLVITLIELLRHVIVHRGGTVADKKEFIDRALSDAGLLNNGKPCPDDIDLIERYFFD